MLKRIDRSAFLSNVIQSLSNRLSQQRGLPVVIGIALVIVSFIVQTFSVFAPHQLLELVGVISLHVGVLIALIGLLLATPLGK